MNALNKNNIAEITALIANIVDSEYDKTHGLRIINIDHDNFDIAESDLVAPSHDWDFENDLPSDDVLDGCSTIGLTDSDDAERIEKIILKSAKLYGYNNKQSKLVLVSGDNMGYGNDDGEVLIDGIANKVFLIDLD